jgi:hypothetical protein
VRQVLETFFTREAFVAVAGGGIAVPKQSGIGQAFAAQASGGTSPGGSNLSAAAQPWTPSPGSGGGGEEKQQLPRTSTADRMDAGALNDRCVVWRMVAEEKRGKGGFERGEGGGREGDGLRRDRRGGRLAAVGLESGEDREERGDAWGGGTL